ncbi:unnamed protein product [Closterium sp. NIES-64]|nr:unnamed protein product [Closterium sp. NIES-64]
MHLARILNPPRLTMAPLISSFNENVRPMLDAIDKLRLLGLKEEGIELPTIVVVGDQSSGKSSVLENLSGISLPRGKGIVTRVPLILRLQSCVKGQEMITIEYTPLTGKVSKVLPDEELIEQEISEATVALAGNRKGVMNCPITLQVQRPDLPDLTLVDLPGITRVPIEDQPKDIYDQVKAMIMHYITPEESVILNVLAAEVDFTTCESIVMSQEVDEDGDRTLAVVTKVDRAPDGLYEKIQGNSVRIGLGYVCVRNKTDADASHDDARRAEAAFFNNHPELSQIEPHCLGIPALAQRLTEIQAKRVADSIPRIRQAIQKALVGKESELEIIPFAATSNASALGIVSSTIQKRRDMMSGVIGGKYGPFQSDDAMHYAARLHEKFNKFEVQMRGVLPDFLGTDYSERCKEALKEVAGISLPNMFDQAVVKQLVQEVVDSVEGPCLLLVNDCFAYATEVQQAVASHICGIYPGLNNVAHLQGLNALRKAKESASRFIQDMLTKEKKVIFTLNHYYMDTVSQIHVKMAEYKNWQPGSSEQGPPPIPSIGDFASSTASLANLISNDDQAARDLQINMFSYAKVMHKRLCDVIPMEIRMCLENALLDGIDGAVWREIHAGDISKIAALKAVDQQRRARLEESIKRLKASEATLLSLAFDVPVAPIPVPTTPSHQPPTAALLRYEQKLPRVQLLPRPSAHSAPTPIQIRPRIRSFFPRAPRFPRSLAFQFYSSDQGPSNPENRAAEYAAAAAAAAAGAASGVISGSNSSSSSSSASSSSGSSGGASGGAGLYRVPVSGGVQSATASHGLPSPAVAVRNLVEQVRRWCVWGQVVCVRKVVCGAGGMWGRWYVGQVICGAGGMWGWWYVSRNLVEQARFAHLCSIMSRMHHRRKGYPFGSLVDFATDDEGRWSGLANARATIFGDVYPVPPSQQQWAQRFCEEAQPFSRPRWSGLANARATIFGDVYPVPPSQQQWAQRFFARRHHHGAAQMWGNFSYYRMQQICYYRMQQIWLGYQPPMVTSISWAGFGTVAWIDVKDYLAATPDAIVLHDSEAILHRQLVSILPQPVDDALFISIDGKGVDIRVRHGAKFNVQRLSFSASSEVRDTEEAVAALHQVLSQGVTPLSNGMLQ